MKIPTRHKKIEVGIEKVNHDAVETLSNNLKVSLKQKNIDSSSKSNPLRRRGKNYDASMRRDRRHCRKKIKKVDELSTKIRVIYLQQ